jgi:trans-aconitate 2-methyltransferase
MLKYQWDALDYEKNSTQQQIWARELVKKLVLHGDETLLDIGCGDGKITAEIAASLERGSAVGIDISENMIALAQQRYPPQAYPNLRFQKEDASHLPFQDAFTNIFSNAALHWLPQHRLALQGIARSLKQEGRILLQMGGKGNAAGVIAVLEQLIHSREWALYFDGFRFPYGFFSPDEYVMWLHEAGLEPIRVELIPKDMVHPGKAGLAGWIRTTWLPYTQRVPENLREAFIDELVDIYLGMFPLDKHGYSHVSMIRLEVEAVKR